MKAIEESLPNGFHDAALYDILIDLQSRAIVMTVGADLSSPAGPESMSQLRRCKVSISGVEYVQVEPIRAPKWPPGSNYISIDAGPLEGDSLHKVHPEILPADCWAYWVFLSNTNSFVHVVARDAKFEWLE
jgi:hypothetical protein